MLVKDLDCTTCLIAFSIALFIELSILESSLVYKT